jgi:hypothetical protein
VLQRVCYKKPRTKPYGLHPFIIYQPINISSSVKQDTLISVYRSTRGVLVASLVKPCSLAEVGANLHDSDGSTCILVWRTAEL